MREHNKLSQKTYNKKAYDYEKTFDGKFISAFKAELVKKVEIHKNDRILDVACGTGVLLNQLLQLHEIEAYGIAINFAS